MKKVIAMNLILFGVVFLAGCGQQPVGQTQPTTPVPVAQTPTQPVATQPTPTIPQADTVGWQTYTNEKYGYEIKYPKDWFLDDGRLSPQKIEYYDIGSDNAPINFGVYTQNRDVFLNSPGVLGKPEILDFGYYEYIKIAKRNNPDSSLEINGLVFQRYDIVDYGRYEGTSAGNVIVLVGPKMENQDLFVVFEWQQLPGGKTLKSNQSQDFIDIASTFKFTK